MDKVYIYGLVDPESDVIRYVGKTTDLYKRYYYHLQELLDKKKENYHSKNWIRNIMQKGIAPKIKILEICNTNNWQEREIFWINFYEDNKLTNMTKGGDGGGMLGKVSPKRLKIDIYKINGIFIKTCESLAEAENFTKVHNGKISEICKQKNGRKSGKGFVFRYHGEPFIYTIRNYSEERDFMKKNIYEIDSNGNILEIYSHALEAANYSKNLRSRIAAACKNPYCKKSPNKINSLIRLRVVKGKYYCYVENYEDIVQSLKKFKSEAKDQATEN